jgi:hypothetical protein
MGVERHHRALQKALLQGINLIDTSANYADGGSEQLVGTVVTELIVRGDLTRESVVIVSKAGYLQGQNYELSQQRKREGAPFPELVLYAEGLEHCIHPEFLADQLTRSLHRLGMETLDVYLLHNPEYYLGWAKKAGLPLADARPEYYRRIKLAFEYLETEVAQRRIQWYGISSNTFPHPATDSEFTALETVWKIAEAISPQHHFRVIQLPMNLLETGGVIEKNQSAQHSVLDFAQEKGLGILINRPLNAISGNRMTRLADVQAETPARFEEIVSAIQELVHAEERMQQELLPPVSMDNATKRQLVELLSAGQILQQHWRSFGTYEHWRDVQTQYLFPRIHVGMHTLINLEHRPPAVNAWLELYEELVHKTFQAVSSVYKVAAAKKSAEIKAQVASVDAEWGSASTLSQMAIRALRSTAGITTVLVGMRQEAYVEDVLRELAQPVETKNREQSWNLLAERLRHKR